MQTPTIVNSASGVSNLEDMMRNLTSVNASLVPQKQFFSSSVKEQPVPKESETAKPEPMKSEVEVVKSAPEKSEAETVKSVQEKPKSIRRKSAKVANSDKSKEPGHYTWQRFGFECDKAIVAKIRNIPKKEGFTNRSVMEKSFTHHLFSIGVQANRNLTTGIEAYEAKHGVAVSAKKSIDDLL